MKNFQSKLVLELKVEKEESKSFLIDSLAPKSKSIGVCYGSRIFMSCFETSMI